MEQLCYIAFMPRLYTHTVVDKLPDGAIKVSEFAKQRKCSHTLIYHELSRGKAKFKLVQFHGINFVVPN